MRRAILVPLVQYGSVRYQGAGTYQVPVYGTRYTLPNAGSRRMVYESVRPSWGITVNLTKEILPCPPQMDGR